MACLDRLTNDHGFTSWPFGPVGWPRIVEIFPRALIRERLRKTRYLERRAYLQRHFGSTATGPLGDQDPVLLERAAGSDDAFDAAISALAMAEHLSELEHLPVERDQQRQIEGQIWLPSAGR